MTNSHKAEAGKTHTHPFNKRTFTLPLLGRSLGGVAVHLPVLARAMIRPSVSPALREKIMLGVTSVNDCRYCSWVHTGLALQNGVDLDDLTALLGQQLGENTREDEAVAILFAKHYADTVRNPSRLARDQLATHFTGRQRREIMAHINAIYYANLTGNSADAVLARLTGRDVSGHAGVQLVAALLGAPVLGLIWWNSRKPGRKPLETL